MKGIGFIYTVVLLFHGILHAVDAMPNGAPFETCARPSLMPLHLQSTTFGDEIAAQKSVGGDTNTISPFILAVVTQNSAEIYTAGSVIPVQLRRSSIYTGGPARIPYKGVMLQMRAGVDPVGQWELDANIPANTQASLGYDFASNYQILQCPTSNGGLGANSVTHTNSGDKFVTRDSGPIFMWRPTTNDGNWDPVTGYGEIHAKGSVVMNRETFWVGIQSNFRNFVNICQGNTCGANQFCQEQGGGVSYVCLCNNGWFGNSCQYNCGSNPPPCANNGNCNTNTADQNVQFCVCQANSDGPLCESYIQCPDNIVQPQTLGAAQTTVTWINPLMMGFGPADPFFFYSADGATLGTTPVGPSLTQASFNTGTTTVMVVGTDGPLTAECSFTVEVDPCNPNPCFNGGVCFPVGGNFVCDCTNTGFIGQTCNVVTADACSPINPCQNGGVCSLVGSTGSVCDCTNTGFMGPTCIERDGCNPSPCDVTGTSQCLTGGPSGFTCVCNNDWVGTFCLYRDPCRANLGSTTGSNTCNPGQCVITNPDQPYVPQISDPNALGFASFTCNCPGGRTGFFCEQLFCSAGCVNGICTDNGGGNSICVCQPGFTGTDCSTLLCNPGCVNGQCVPINLVPTCICNSGYTGNDCSTPLCNPGCVNGQCFPINNVPTCQCNSGYTGNDCSTPLCNPGCVNGQCFPINNVPTCLCNLGYTGNDCSTPLCNPVCVNGQCFPINNVPTCQCNPGYTGNDCSTPSICNPSCINGQCNVLTNPPTCTCSLGYSGPVCDILTSCLTYNCLNGGICQPINGDPLVVFCNCDNTGFTGTFCTDPPAPVGCNAFPCRNGGFCAPQGQFGYQCFCTNPFVGTNCENRDECLTTVCQNGGTCNTDTNGFFTTCTNCNPGYSGTLCEIFNPCTPGFHQCVNGQCIPNPGSTPPYICQCNPGGWHGEFCDRAPTGCSDTPCSNGGVCSTEGTTGFRCSCINNYFGDTCEYRDNCIYGNINCLNGGTCVSNPLNGVFVTCESCNTGFSGTFCEIDVCNSNQCQNGLCIRTGATSYSCQCFQGWLGEYCDQPLQTGCVPEPCRNGGVCTPVGTADYRCTCPAGYYGPTCETRDGCDSQTCQNGGECTVNPVTGAFMGCVNCDLGYSGLYCELYVCDYQYCANGQCVPLSDSNYRCECPPQWTGQYCERPAACEPNPCGNGGTCTADATGRFYCMCVLSQWTGDTCQTPVACQSGAQNPCQNGGTCRPTAGSSYICECSSAWTGEFCQIAVVCLDPSRCRNGGTCTYSSSGDFTGCLCPPGYLGEQCELDGCSSNNCNDNGFCQAVNNQAGYTCRCFNGYTGQDCQIPPVCGVDFANDPCRPNGICEEISSFPPEFRCTCYDGFNGDRCEGRDPCYNNPCQNGGQCTNDGLGSFTCQCYSGYIGLYCEQRPVCANNPCYNGGICIPDTDNGYQFRCDCVGPYTGQRCEILSGCNNNPCLNGAQCIADENGGFRCNCVRGYTGITCSIEPVCSTNPCYNGDCIPINGAPTCRCWDGYYGPYCDKRNECYSNNPCQNDGICYFDEQDGGAKCDCTELFSGSYCEIPNFRLCDINICFNGGTCWDEPERGSVCTCISGYGGDVCEHVIISCEERFCDNGECIEADFARGKTSRCRCESGWTGEQCNQRFENPCARTPCTNGGICQYYSQYGGDYMCNCRPGYTGKDCQNSVTPPKAAASRIQMVSLWTLIAALGFYLLSSRL